MKHVELNKQWTFRRSFLDSIGMLESDPGVQVDLPHDGMIGTDVTPNAPAGTDMGFFTGGLTNYTKYLEVPAEWEDDCVGLAFDGVMMNCTIDVNGSKVAAQHFGYAPFYVDLTDYVTFGASNRITINTNTSMQPNSRWYTGSGLYRGVELCHGPRLHVAQDGVFVYTKEVSDGLAIMEAQIDVENTTIQNRLAEVCITITKEGCEEVLKTVIRKIQINARSKETARMGFTMQGPELWDAENPNLYRAHVTVTNLGVYRTRFVADEKQTVDESSALFGIRTVTVDTVRGLRINGKTVKLKGGCLHHDNGLLGSVTMYEVEARKVRKLKEVGFNAIRTTHNPPSKALIEACDRLGMYVFDEAFDAWGMSKRAGDYGQYFDDCWEKDLTAFVRRDRTHPCVVIWSTGNEIPERGGMDNGYTLATRLAETVRSLDGTRPVSNGICSMWSGLDDVLAASQRQEQNAAGEAGSTLWERVTEPFTNGLDVVGYNYMEDQYEMDHEMFPDRVILGSENFPKEIGFRWPLVERLPYAIGDFTWTAWDYLGEAHIGKALYVEKDDPVIQKGPWGVMDPIYSPFPWRTANDADYDITGRMLPQGAYRSVVWGSEKTYLFTKHPDTYGKVELLSMWGFPELLTNWNYFGYEQKPVEIMVFSNAEEVEVLINGRSLGRKHVCMERPLPNSVIFEAPYEAGIVEAISYRGGKEISRDFLKTTKAAASLALLPEKEVLSAGGNDLLYVNIEVLDADGLLVPDATIALQASVSGAADMAGFGTGNPCTDENYTDDVTTTYRGRAQLILRSTEETGEVKVKIAADGMEAELVILVK